MFTGNISILRAPGQSAAIGQRQRSARWHSLASVAVLYYKRASHASLDVPSVSVNYQNRIEPPNRLPRVSEVYIDSGRVLAVSNF